MPRKPIGPEAMTDAERQRKRRERLRQERGPTTERDAKIDALTKANGELRARLRHMKQFYEQQSRRGIMSFTTYAKVMRCLHPDSDPSPEQKQEACGLLSQWKQGGEKARRR